MVDEWNGLNNQVVSVESLGSFRRFDRFMDGDDKWKIDWYVSYWDCHV